VSYNVPVYVRVHAERLFVDPRTLQPGEDDEVVAAFVELAR
jgi:hypothetical protein